MNVLGHLRGFQLEKSTTYENQRTQSHSAMEKIGELISSRGISILGEVRNVEISRVTEQLLCSKSHDFLAIFPLGRQMFFGYF